MGRTLKDIKPDIKNSTPNGAGLAPPAKQLRREIRSTKRNPIDVFATISPDSTRKVWWF